MCMKCLYIQTDTFNVHMLYVCAAIFELLILQLCYQLNYKLVYKCYSTCHNFITSLRIFWTSFYCTFCWCCCCLLGTHISWWICCKDCHLCCCCCNALSDVLAFWYFILLFFDRMSAAVVHTLYTFTCVYVWQVHIYICMSNTKFCWLCNVLRTQACTYTSL